MSLDFEKWKKSKATKKIMKLLMKDWNEFISGQLKLDL
jgi:hypothetical protein